MVVGRVVGGRGGGGRVGQGRTGAEALKQQSSSASKVAPQQLSVPQVRPASQWASVSQSPIAGPHLASSLQQSSPPSHAGTTGTTGGGVFFSSFSFLFKSEIGCFCCLTFGAS